MEIDTKEKAKKAGEILDRVLQEELRTFREMLKGTFNDEDVALYVKGIKTFDKKASLEDKLSMFYLQFMTINNRIDKLETRMENIVNVFLGDKHG